MAASRAARFTRWSVLLLAVAGLRCDRSGRDPHSGGDDAGLSICADGAHSCAGKVWNVCQAGGWSPVQTCTDDNVCTDALGCTPCAPGLGACSGDRIVECDDNGHPAASGRVVDCMNSTCIVGDDNTAQCAGPCDPKVLAKSYTGCVYYAADLPQWGLPTPGTNVVAASQQFAVAVANPWTVPVRVAVEVNNATVGSPARTSQIYDTMVAPGSVGVVKLPPREVSGFVASKTRSASLLSANAFRITTSRPTSVYQFNPQNNPGAYSNDASLLIPVNALDESYVVLGWPGAGGDVSAFGQTIQTDKRSFVTIVGTAPDTKLRVTPSTEVMAGANVPAMHKGMSYTFTLGEFEALNLEGADFDKVGATDFTGTRVEASAPVAIWSGVECITINPKILPPDQGTCCCDHLEEQVFPRASLGPEYVAVRSEGRSHNIPDWEFFRILALDAGTTVTTSLAPPDDSFTLGAGQVRELTVMEDFTIKASKAVMVGQFQVSQDSSFGKEGDPSFELVPPIAQHRTRYVFLVPSGYMENWALISIPTGMDLQLDGQNPIGCERETAGAAAGMMYDAVRCPVSAGAHDLSASVAFGLVVEGWGPGPVSYGYTGGMEFKNVNHDCTTDANCPNAEFCAGGVCAPLIQ